MVFSFLETVTVSSHLRRLFFSPQKAEELLGEAGLWSWALCHLYISSLSGCTWNLGAAKNCRGRRGEKVTVAGDGCHCSPELIPPRPLSAAARRKAFNGLTALEIHVDLSPSD